MAYAVTHLCVAWKLLEQGAPIRNVPSFLLGAVAPDAVHYRQGGVYTSDWKLFAHLGCPSPEEIPEKWGYITEIARWRDRILRFAAETRHAPQRDFRLGYLTHILTDLCNTTIVWQPFLKMQGGTFDRAAYQLYGAECRAVDMGLLAAHPAREQLTDAVLRAVPCGMYQHGDRGKTLVSAAEVAVLQTVLRTETLAVRKVPEVGGNRYARVEAIERLIEQSVQTARATLCV